MIKLYEHQQKILVRAIDTPRYGIYWDTGTGKTHAALSIIAAVGGRTIIVTRPSVIEAWEESARQWELRAGCISSELGAEYYHNVPWLSKQKNIAEAKAAIARSADIIILSHETLHAYKHLFKSFDTLILDESHKVNGHTTRVAKSVYALSKTVSRLYCLTATPTPNSILDIWPQMQLLAPGLLGRHSDFLLQFGNAIQMGASKFAVKYFPKRGVETIIKQVCNPYCEYLDKRECTDLPAITVKTLYCELNTDEVRRYKEYKAFYRSVNTDNVAKRMQISSGQVYTETGLETVHTAKRGILTDSVASIKGKIIIWCQYNHEKIRVAQWMDAIGVVHCEQKEWQRFIAEDGIKCLIAHPAALGTGTDGLQRVCSYHVWYSVGHSFVDYYQSTGRSDRIGQIAPLTSIRLIARDTYDTDAWHCVDAKKNLLDFLRQKEG
jgi:hypothetical protein